MKDRSIKLSGQVVPAALRETPNWVYWCYVERDGKQTKCPFNARTGGRANTTDASTWSSFDEAVQAREADELAAGIGIVFATDGPYSGIDLDNCRDPATGEVKEWAQKIIDFFDSYTEISPSGTGVKIFLRGRKRGKRCKKGVEDGGAIEIYDRDRFFTVTGRHLAGTPCEVNDRQEALDNFYTELFEPVPNATASPESATSPADISPGTGSDRYALTDDDITQIASRSKTGEKFKSLLAGNWSGLFNSQSEADSSLVFTLAWYTKDAGQIDRMFRRSGLMREKWDEKHGTKTYGQMTIDKAIEVMGNKQYQRRRPTQKSAVLLSSDGDDGDGVPRDDKGMIALGEREPETGRLVLSPKKTWPTAKAGIDHLFSHADGRTLHSHAGLLWEWRGNRYVELEEESLRQMMHPFLHDALRYQCNKQTHQMELVDFESNPGTVTAAIESIRAYVHLPASKTPPAWLDDRGDRPDPGNLLPFPSGTLDVTTGEVLAPTPALFNINAIDFDYEPDPDPPERWIKFLEQLWGDDLESVRLLQEWMGYVLVADTSQQKMLLMVGPKRSGKGTIGRLMSRLVGNGNVVGPTTSSLAGSFGLQPLIGKSLAVVSDARFTGENVGVVLERLLCISGEDTLTVDRKFLGSVTMKLPTRFVFLTNELPRMNDASGALAGRFVILRLTRSFYGKEDTTLTQQLMGELPGILHWAIEGLKRLRERGHFVQPEVVSEAVREMEDLASPVLAFVRDCCVIATGRRVWVDDLYNAWEQWCKRDGRTAISNKQTFGRDLAAAVPGIVRRRGAGDVPFYDGMGLKEVRP